MLNASLSRSLVRRFLTVFAMLAATTAALFGQTPSAADGFDPNVDGNVFAVAVQADGKTVIAGQFTSLRPNGSVSGVSRNNLARLNADGSVDSSFDPNPNGPVRALVIQADGRILIGGDFTFLQPGGGATATTRNRVARLNADGTLDTGFNPNINGPLQPQVFTIALQADGQILIGGNFATVQPAGAAAATARRNLVRISGAGAVDATYNPNPNGMVLALAAHIDGKTIVSGGFTTFQENGKPEVTTRNHVARLNADGTVDSEFDPNANFAVSALAIQRDGKVILGGAFTTLQPRGEQNLAVRNHLARLNPDGSFDSEFLSSASGNVAAIALQPDGGFLVGGNFSAVWGRGAATVSRSYLARFMPDGSVDAAFNSGLNSQVEAIGVQPDGKIIVGGYFTRAQPPGVVSTAIRNRVARLNANGSLDTNFELDAGGRPLVSVVQADGKIIIAGSFTNVGGAAHNYIARLGSDGLAQSSYTTNLDGRVLAMVLQPDGKLLIGGVFTSIGGEPRNHIARLNPSGTIDSEFNPNIDGQVGALALQADGKIIVGGNFSAVKPIGVADPVLRHNVLRLTATGQLDTPFDPSPSSAVTSILVQGDGKVILGGNFTSLAPNGATGSTIRNRIVRVNSDGTLDTAFNPDLSDNVTALALQSDGKIIAGGSFTSLAPNGATTTTTRNRIVRINPDGTVDAGFDPNANNNILALALQADGKILIGGPFTTLQPNGAADWTLRKYAARLNADGTVDSTFNLDIDEQGGNRVDSLRIMSDGRILLGGNFSSLAPVGTGVRTVRKNFARINANGTLDGSFDLGSGGATGAVVNALALQADGKVIAVGSFGDLGGARTVNLARFTAEGAPDATFSTTVGVDGPVNSVVVRPNGLPVASQLTGFAWLNRDGSLRSAFAPGSEARLSGRVSVVIRQTDGKILIGGAFSNLSNTTNGNLARFSPDGTLDLGFNPSINGEVTGLAQQSDGQLIVVGSFTLVNGVVRNRVVRLKADGSVDSAYDPNVEGKVSAVVIQSDNKVVIAGGFSKLTPSGTTTAVSRPYLARLNADSSLDTAYNPTPGGPVTTLAIQGDGKVIAGGQFVGFQPNGAALPTERNFVARINTDGTLDDFNPLPNGPVNVVVVQPNGSILLGGSFTALQPNAGTVVTRNNVARVASNGTVDTAFNPNANAAVNSLSLQADGAILLAGIFTALQSTGSDIGVARNQLARVNSDGTLDLAFNPDVAGTVASVASLTDGSVLVSGSFAGVQPNGLVLIGGTFANVGGLPLRNLALLNNDGSVNGSFTPNPNAAVNVVVTLPDGRFVVGGLFTSAGGATRNRLARFNANGTLDLAFNPNAGGEVYALALQPDGKLLVGGAFSTVGGQGRAGFARLNPDGSVDTAFGTAGATGLAGLGVRAIAVQSDGRILVVREGSGVRQTLLRLNADGTADNTFAAQSDPSGTFSAIAVQADGRIVAAGSFQGTVVVLPVPGPTARPAWLARFNPDGSVDGTFNPGPNGAVTALALQSDGRLMIGGSFTRVGALTRVALARLASTGSAIQTVGVTADRRNAVWTRSGTSGDVAAAIFEFSADNRTWSPLGTGTRIASSSNWQITGLQLPASGLFYVRARGVVSTSGGTAASLYETVREFNFTNPLPQISSTAPIVSIADATTVSINGSTGLATISSAKPAGNPSQGGTPPVQGAPGSEVPAGGGIDAARLADISARGVVGANTPLIVGFTIGGTTTRTVLVRAAGPSLAHYDVSGYITAPKLRLYDANRMLIAENSGWTMVPGLATVAAQSGAFPFELGSEDAATAATLSPGSYTMEVLDRSGVGGVALAEVYDAGTAAQSAATRLVNLSGRGTTGIGGNAFMGGFIITGNVSKNLLVRGIGPTLANYGVLNPIADPSVSVYDATGRLLASNDNWSNGGSDGLISANTGALQAAALQTGAFALPVGSKDAALTITLPPGAYTVQVGGAAGTTGPALIELYELP